jgi:hypothetical protein
MRAAVFEALKVAAPATFNDALRDAFLGGMNFNFAGLGLDSLGTMEFCIAIELSTGITLLPAQLEELASTAAIERYLDEQLGARTGSAE